MLTSAPAQLGWHPPQVKHTGSRDGPWSLYNPSSKGRIPKARPMAGPGRKKKINSGFNCSKYRITHTEFIVDLPLTDTPCIHRHDETPEQIPDQAPQRHHLKLSEPISILSDEAAIGNAKAAQPSATECQSWPILSGHEAESRLKKTGSTLAQPTSRSHNRGYKPSSKPSIKPWY